MKYDENMKNSLTRGQRDTLLVFFYNLHKKKLFKAVLLKMKARIKAIRNLIYNSFFLYFGKQVLQNFQFCYLRFVTKHFIIELKDL